MLFFQEGAGLGGENSFFSLELVTKLLAFIPFRVQKWGFLSQEKIFVILFFV